MNDAFLNAAQFGTYSMLKQDRANLSLNLEHDLFNKRLVLFGNFIYAHDETEAQLAPAPGPFLEQANVVIPANNPYNPFGTALGGPVNPPNIRTALSEAATEPLTPLPMTTASSAGPGACWRPTTATNWPAPTAARINSSDS